MWPFKRSPKRRKQTCFVFCPTCNLEQIANNCFVEDTDLVRYTCTQCGTKTEWNFDIAPVPILYSVDGALSHYFKEV